MIAAGENIHATAIVTGTIGLLFTGPSGSGKSALAFACLAAARQQGLFAALVSDDRVIVTVHDGRLIAHRPPQIRDLIELRYGGIATIDSIPAALLHYAVLPVDTETAERLPPDGETLRPLPGGQLPLIRIPSGIPSPYAFLEALISSRHSL
ncbi:MAG: HPr kinase/phosphorylase [Allorhizobium sp.]